MYSVQLYTYSELNIKKTLLLKEVERWFSTNQLKINTAKTEILEFGRCCPFGGASRSLGVSVYAGLTWRPHIESVCRKLSKALYCICRIRLVAGQKAAEAAYFANFMNVASYGLVIWGNTSFTGMVFKIQKKTVRMLFGMQPRDRAFESIRILSTN